MNKRKSTRLKGYNYASEGSYFITINAKLRKLNHFGHILNGRMILNKAGVIVQNEWLNTEKIRSNVILDEFVVMPDHFHAVLFLTGTQMVECYHMGEYDSPIQKKSPVSFESPSQTIGAIVRGFKSTCTKKFNSEKLNILWQRNYHDRIIRDGRELLNIQNYIINNPSNWVVK
jgi:REP element-mobilizing transposase RayT